MMMWHAVMVLIRSYCIVWMGFDKTATSLSLSLQVCNNSNCHSGKGKNLERVGKV